MNNNKRLVYQFYGNRQYKNSCRTESLKAAEQYDLP